jgi:hypothetical protein
MHFWLFYFITAIFGPKIAKEIAVMKELTLKM